jgi:RNA polymerase sigma factor (sigma-70 family)
MKVGRHRRARPVDDSAGRDHFELLYRTQVRLVLAYALRRVDRPEDAADVVAETMLVAWRRQHDVPAGDEARLWLFGVARRVLANHRRGVGRRDRLGDRLRQELQHLVVADPAAAVETTLVVRQALDQLDELDREVMQLTAWESLTPGEVAVVLSIPPTTVRTRLHRARRRLRVALDLAGLDVGERAGCGGHEMNDERLLARHPEDDL